MTKTAICTAFSVLLLAGCAGGPKIPEGPPNWREAYAHGCRAGEAEAGNVTAPYFRDEGLYATDETYNTAWDNGFQTCMGAYEPVDDEE